MYIIIWAITLAASEQLCHPLWPLTLVFLMAQNFPHQPHTVSMVTTTITYIQAYHISNIDEFGNLIKYD